MINLKDVITLRIPYPDSTSGLAKKSHMYICINVTDTICELVKCQSLKPYHSLSNSEPKHRLIVPPDITCNPFRHPTVIDLDKLFVAKRSLFPDTLKATCGINDALFSKIQCNISKAIEKVPIPTSELQAINPMLCI